MLARLTSQNSPLNRTPAKTKIHSINSSQIQHLQEQEDEADPKPAHTPEPHDRAACNVGKDPTVDRPGVDDRTNDKRNRRLAGQDTKHDNHSHEH